MIEISAPWLWARFTKCTGNTNNQGMAAPAHEHLNDAFICEQLLNLSPCLTPATAGLIKCTKNQMCFSSTRSAYPSTTQRPLRPHPICCSQLNRLCFPWFQMIGVPGGQHTISFCCLKFNLIFSHNSVLCVARASNLYPSPLKPEISPGHAKGICKYTTGQRA